MKIRFSNLLFFILAIAAILAYWCERKMGLQILQNYGERYELNADEISTEITHVFEFGCLAFVTPEFASDLLDDVDLSKIDNLSSVVERNKPTADTLTYLLSFLGGESNMEIEDIDVQLEVDSISLMNTSSGVAWKLVWWVRTKPSHAAFFTSRPDGKFVQFANLNGDRIPHKIFLKDTFGSRSLESDAPLLHSVLELQRAMTLDESQKTLTLADVVAAAKQSVDRQMKNLESNLVFEFESVAPITVKQKGGSEFAVWKVDFIDAAERTVVKRTENPNQRLTIWVTEQFETSIISSETWDPSR